MVWFAVATGSIGAITGVYGAWRSWRTDRANRLLGRKWEIDARPDDEFLITNRQPRAVYAPKVVGPDGHVVLPVHVPASLLPNEGLVIAVLVTYEHDDGPIEVTWHHRPDLKDAPKRWRGFLPPGGGGSARP